MRAQRHSPAADPFAMLMDPQAVIDAMQRSTRLDGLSRRICRPLDKPLIPKSVNAEMAAFDQEVDGEPTAIDEGDDLVA